MKEKSKDQGIKEDADKEVEVLKKTITQYEVNKKELESEKANADDIIKQLKNKLNQNDEDIINKNKYISQLEIKISNIQGDNKLKEENVLLANKNAEYSKTISNLNKNLSEAQIDLQRLIDAYEDLNKKYKDMDKELVNIKEVIFTIDN